MAATGRYPAAATHDCGLSPESLSGCSGSLAEKERDEGTGIECRRGKAFGGIATVETTGVSTIL